MEPGRASYRSHAFVVRLLQESPHSSWRIFLQSAATGERVTFSDLEALLVHLQRVCNGDEAEATSPEGDC